LAESRQGGPIAAGEALPRKARIRLTNEIRALLERGKRKRTPNVDVFFAHSPASCSRLGLLVPKHGRSIVARNRVKRCLREIGRREVLPELDAAGKKADVMIRARWKAYDASHEELSREVRGAVRELCSEAF
jgi:ribonuclease P protein component